MRDAADELFTISLRRGEPRRRRGPNALGRGLPAMLRRSMLGLVALAAGLAACGVERYRERPPARDLALRAVVASEGDAVELVPRQDGGAPLPLARAVLVDADHVRHVRLLDAADGRRVLVLEVDDVGVARLGAATERAEGMRIAVVAGGRVVAAPTLRGRLDAHELVLALPAERLDAAFHEVAR